MPGDLMPAAIGGYLELAYGAPAADDSMLAYQSCRAAFHALLAHGRPTRVWLPTHTCDAMLAPVRVLNVPCTHYPLADDLSAPENITLGPDDWLVYVNYFGLCDHHEARLLQRYPRHQLVFDHAQAGYSAPPDALATLYSPRKFFGLPDGGLMSTALPIAPAAEAGSDASLQRMRHLLQRLADGPETGYAAFQWAEASLADSTPQRMSSLTRRLLQGANAEAARERRNANYVLLHELLGSRNVLPLASREPNGPLCYPFVTDGPDIRGALARERIYVATYWPEVRARSVPGSIERRLVDHCLPLPCDQRYGPAEMERLAARVLALSGA